MEHFYIDRMRLTLYSHDLDIQIKCIECNVKRIDLTQSDDTRDNHLI
jgi:hypothetical protein